MTMIPESHQSLLKTDVGVLGTIGPDGFPQVTALWFIVDDDGLIKFYLNSSRQKVKNLQARPKASFLIVDPANPYKTVEIRGRVEMTPDPDYAFASKLTAKYGAVDFSAMDKPGQVRLLVTLHPTKVNTWGE